MVIVRFSLSRLRKVSEFNGIFVASKALEILCDARSC